MVQVDIAKCWSVDPFGDIFNTVSRYKKTTFDIMASKEF